MTDSAPAPTIRMRDAGYYSANTVGAQHVIDAAIPLMERAVAEVTLGEGAVTVADFGAADGGTSLGLHRALIAALRKRAPGHAVTLTYTDLPHNDFSTLFRLTQGSLPGREGGLADLNGVFVFASGSSFYRRIFPSNTLRVGFSGTAMHWLSRLPAQLDDAVHSALAHGPARDAFAHQAAADWQTILLHRAAELAPGGRLVLCNFCEDENGHYLGFTGAQNMHATFTRHWQALRDDGTLTPVEFAAATFPQHYKTVAAFRAPFDDPAGPVRQAGLMLEHIETRTTPCPYAAAFARHGDGRAFAAAYVPTLRSWSENVFLAALDPGRPEPTRRTIIDRFYAAYEDDVAQAPTGHAMDYVHCFMLIAKTDG